MQLSICQKNSFAKYFRVSLAVTPGCHALSLARKYQMYSYCAANLVPRAFSLSWPAKRPWDEVLCVAVVGF